MSLPTLIYESKKLWDHTKKSPEQVQADSLTRFRQILKYAWNKTTFYPGYWKAHGISYSDLSTISPADIPCITKSDVRNHFEDMSVPPVRRDANEELQPAPGRILIHSSGSTGVPTTFLYSKSALTKIEANFVRLSNLGGRNLIGWKDFPIRNIHAASVGSGYASTAILYEGLSKYHAKNVLLRASEPLTEWVAKIGDFNPNYLSGYPSCIAFLLELQQKGEIDLHPLKIITGGEPLNPLLKKKLAGTFRADVIDYYGCCESLLVGAGSSWYDGLYLFDDMNYCETDAQGHLILTPLYNPAFPLVRYKLDDLVQGFSRVPHGPLPFTHIDKIIGRDEDILWFVNEDGRQDFLHPLVIDDLYADGLQGLQFIQISDCAFRVDCVSEAPGDSVKQNLCKEIDQILQAKHMRNLHYEVRFCPGLQVNPQSGKVPLTVKIDG